MASCAVATAAAASAECQGCDGPLRRWESGECLKGLGESWGLGGRETLWGGGGGRPDRGGEHPSAVCTANRSQRWKESDRKRDGKKIQKEGENKREGERSAALYGAVVCH